MTHISIREARKHLSDLIKATERGESVNITRRGKPVARLVPVEPEKAPPPLPDLTAFRASIKIRGKPMSQTVIDMRAAERY